MCDSYVVMADTSASGMVTLCKNSDRPSFDSQALVFHGRKRFPKGTKLSLAYVSIEETQERFATLGSSPYWCWGYEEGINEYGVAIGNEAVYTKDLVISAAKEREGNGPDKGLLGMELLRLGLERGKTAKEALSVLTELIERYGQWGSAVPMSDTVKGSYDNSFLVADGKEAYILETAGKRWAVRQIKDGYAAISNELSIRTDLSMASADLVEHAREKGWYKEGAFDFAKAYIDQKSPRQLSHIRVQRMKSLLAEGREKEGRINERYMKRILRDHYEDTFLGGPMFNPSSPDFLTLCMHGSPAGFTWGDTASSCIVRLPDDGDHLPVFWWAPGVPCCSLYLPFFVDGGMLPETVTKVGTYGKEMCAPDRVRQPDSYAKGSFWWRMRKLLWQINGDEDGSTYLQKHEAVRAVFDPLEATWESEVEEIAKKAAEMKRSGRKEEMETLLKGYMQDCVLQAEKAMGAVEEMLRET